MVLLVALNHHRNTVVEAEYGPIGRGSESPLPAILIIISVFAGRHHADSFKQRIQCDIYDFAGPGGKGDVFTYGGEERGSTYPQVVVARSQSGDAEAAICVSVGQQVLSCTNREHFHGRAHLCDA